MIRLDSSHFKGIGPKAVRQVAFGGRLTDAQIVEAYLDPYTRFGRIIVDRPAEDCTRRGWKIVVDDSSDGVDPFADEMQRLEVVKKFREAHVLARLYGGAGIVMIIDDDGAIDEPISGKVRGIKALQVLSRTELLPGDLCEDIQDHRFGQPLFYYLSPVGTYDGMQGRVVHADRVIPWYGLPVPAEYRTRYLGWGQSVIEAAFATLTDMDVATNSVREAIDQFQYNVLKLRGLAQILTGPDGDADNSAFQARLDAIEEGKRRTRHVVIDADDSYEPHASAFTGLIDAYQVSQQNLSAVTRIPITLLFGQSPSGLSTDDQSGTRNYYDGIRAEQSEKYEPAISRLVEILAESGVGPKEGWRVDFADLMAPSDAEQAEIDRTYAETDAINISNGVITPDEARTRYSAGTVGKDIVLKEEPSSDETYQEMIGEYRRIMEEGGDLGELPEAPSYGAPAAFGASEAPEREINGGHIDSMADLVQRVARGELPKPGAIEIMKISFGLSTEQASRFFSSGTDDVSTA